MRLVFVSNYLTHHQIPICNAFQQLLGEGKFHFISTIPMEEWRKDMGWNISGTSAYEIRAYESQDSKQEALNCIAMADCVLIGATSREWLEHAIKFDHVVFTYSERLFKRGYQNIIRPGFLKHSLWHHKHLRNKKVYSLCASAYLPGDYYLLREYSDKCFRWGYFPEFKGYKNLDELLEAKQPNSIIWVGRLIELKHPEYAVEVARRLKQDGIPFCMKFVGDGELRDTLEKRVVDIGIQDCVTFTGNMPYEQVRNEMEQSTILLATSDFNEGWGAVINEGMNAGCAVVASHAMGSAPFLIHQKSNGIIFQSGNVDALYEAVKELLASSEKRYEMGKAAYKTIDEKWNAHSAAERLLTLSEAIQKDGNLDLYDDGPCSKAPVLWNGWFKEQK